MVISLNGAWVDTFMNMHEHIVQLITNWMVRAEIVVVEDPCLAVMQTEEMKTHTM